MCAHVSVFIVLSVLLFHFPHGRLLKSASARAVGPTCRNNTTTTTTINALASPLPYYYYYDCEIVMLLYKQLLLPPRVYYCRRYIIRARNKNVPKYFANKGRDVNHDGAEGGGGGGERWVEWGQLMPQLGGWDLLDGDAREYRSRGGRPTEDLRGSSPLRICRVTSPRFFRPGNVRRMTKRTCVYPRARVRPPRCVAPL